MRKRQIGFLLCALSLLVSACAKASDKAAVTVETYLQALAAKNSDRIAALSCADWEPMARMEVDSFQAVEIRLEGLACEEIARQDNEALVQCAGKIIATYNNEDQEIDLSLRTYRVVEQDGEYLVCGYQ